MGGFFDGIKGWASQAAGSPPSNYETHVLYPWAAITHGIDPGGATVYDDEGSLVSSGTAYPAYDNFFTLDDDGDFNIASELYALRRDAGGSPYENIAAYDPDADIARIEDALNQIQQLVLTQEPEEDFPKVVELAIAQADALISEEQIDNVVEAFEARQRTEHLAAVSRTLGTLWDAGALLTTQTLNTVAILEDGYNRTVADYSAKLRLAHQETRNRAALSLVGSIQNTDNRDIQVRQLYLTAAMDTLKYKVTTKQDQIDKDVGYLTADLFWDLSLLQMALQANSAIYGAQVVDRAQTKGERLLATISGSISSGIQVGQATGNAGAGAAFGGLNLLSNLLLT